MNLKQSQKLYMVSGSLCPLIIFFDVSYLVSFVVRGSGPAGDDDLWYHHIGEPLGAWSQLGGPWSLLECPQSQLGGLWSQLGGPWSRLEGSLSKLGVPWSQLGGLLSLLRGPESQLGGPWSQLGGP